MLNLSLDWKAVIATALVGAGAVWVAKKALEKTAEAVVETTTEAAKAVNPVDEGNIFNRAFNAITKAITGKDEPLGAQIYDWLHRQPQDEQGKEPGGLIEKLGTESGKIGTVWDPETELYHIGF